jgi:hypothetical protein
MQEMDGGCRRTADLNFQTSHFRQNTATSNEGVARPLVEVFRDSKIRSPAAQARRVDGHEKGEQRCWILDAGAFDAVAVATKMYNVYPVDLSNMSIIWYYVFLLRKNSMEGTRAFQTACM